MKVESFRVGDVFLSDGGIRVTVKEISCQNNPQESRWETSVDYEYGIHRDEATGIMTAKAWVFVKMVSEDRFHTQIPAGTNVSQVTSGGVADPTDFSLSPPSPPSNPPGQLSEMAQQFIANASRYGLSPNDLGRAVRLGKKRFLIVGAKPRNWKLPILVSGRQGGVYKVSVERVKKGLV